MACELRRQWESSILASCQPGYMARLHAQAVRAYTAAVSAAGNCAVKSTCAATLGHLGRVVSVVVSLLNRNLTAAYWERVEAVLPLDEVRNIVEGGGCDARGGAWVVVDLRLHVFEGRTFSAILATIQEGQFLVQIVLSGGGGASVEIAHSTE